MEHLIVVNNPADWNLDIPGVKVVAARKYLSDPSFSDLDKVKVYNLCGPIGTRAPDTMSLCWHLLEDTNRCQALRPSRI